MATKTFNELKQMAIQIRDEKTNKQNTANRIGTEMLEHLDKLEQDYYDKTTTDEELKKRDDKLTELSSKINGKISTTNVIPEQMTDQCYIGVSGELVERTEGDYSITKFIPVKAGDKVYIKTTGSPGKVCILGFKKSITNNSITDFPIDEVLVTSKEGDTYEPTEDNVEISEDGYIISSYIKNSEFTLKIESIIQDGLVQSISEQGNAISEQGNTISEQGNTISEQGNTISELYRQVNGSYSTTNVIPEQMTDQYYIGVSGELVERTEGDYSITKFIPVKAGDKVYIKTTGSPGKVCILGFKKSITNNSITDFPIDEVLVTSKEGDTYEPTEDNVEISEDGYIISSYIKNSEFTLKIESIIQDGLVQNINNLSQEVINLKERVTDLESHTTDNNPLANIITDGGQIAIFSSIGQIGDSLASGEMAYADAEDESTTKYIDMYDQSWLSFIGRAINRTIYNFSKGGASTTSFLAGETSYPSDYMNGANIFDVFQEKKCQAYFIALAHNDRNNVIRSEEYISASDDNERLSIIKNAIGNPTDISDVNNILSNNIDTYYVRYAKIIKYIKQIQPYAKIFPITCKTGRSKNNMWEKEGWNDAIRYMAQIYDDVYIIDMGKWADNIPSWHYTQGHGNAMGYMAYGNEIATYVDWLINNNRNYFMYTSFIGTEVEKVAIKDSSIGSVGSTFV